MADTDNFLVSGEKKAQFSTNPMSVYRLEYVLLPLVPGRIGLPKFDITMLRNINPKQSKPVVQEQFIFVKPMVADTFLV